MSTYLQYHNGDREPLFLHKQSFCLQDELSIYTRNPAVRRAAGRVLVIVGVGRPRRYFLWTSFQIAAHLPPVGAGDPWRILGPGWQLAPPQELHGPDFEAFRRQCANFVGFRCIDALPYCGRLLELAERFQPRRQPGAIAAFLQTLLDALPANDPQRLLALHRLVELDPAGQRLLFAERQRFPGVALSVQQPHAEAILRGVKREEYRSLSTGVRGRAFLYATKSRPPDEAAFCQRYDIAPRDAADLPRGAVVGSVEIAGVRALGPGQFAWNLQRPQRLAVPLPPMGFPQPMWFKPFG